VICSRLGLVVAPADRAVAAYVRVLVAALVVGVHGEVPDVDAEFVEREIDFEVADPDAFEFDFAHRRPLSAARPSRRTTDARPILARLHSTDARRGRVSQTEIQPRRPSRLPQNTAPRARPYLSEIRWPGHAPDL